MEREQLEKHLASFKAAEECYPFGPEVMVFKVIGKMFAFLVEREGVPTVTIKCVPFDGEILIEEFESIVPGHYMHKKHWISVSLTDEIPEDMLRDLVDKSYALVVNKLTKANRLKLQ